MTGTRSECADPCGWLRCTPNGCRQQHVIRNATWPKCVRHWSITLTFDWQAWRGDRLTLAFRWRVLQL